MARKKKRQLSETEEVNWGLVNRLVRDMKLKDIQRACVARGMPFEEVVGSSVLGLHSWFANNYDRGQNLNLLNEYDIWMAEKLLQANPEYTPDHPINHPSLRLGYMGHKDEDGEVKKKKLRLKGLEKPKKKKKARVEGTKVIAGTKKGLTYQLTREGLDFDALLEKVEASFDDVNEKSVLIWHKRCLKEIKDEAGKGSKK